MKLTFFNWHVSIKQIYFQNFNLCSFKVHGKTDAAGDISSCPANRSCSGHAERNADGSLAFFFIHLIKYNSQV